MDTLVDLNVLVSALPSQDVVLSLDPSRLVLGLSAGLVHSGLIAQRAGQQRLADRLVIVGLLSVALSSLLTPFVIFLPPVPTYYSSTVDVLLSTYLPAALASVAPLWVVDRVYPTASTASSDESHQERPL